MFLICKRGQAMQIVATNQSIIKLLSISNIIVINLW